jgi:hypothetical protein
MRKFELLGHGAFVASRIPITVEHALPKNGSMRLHESDRLNFERGTCRAVWGFGRGRGVAFCGKDKLDGLRSLWISKSG